MKIGRLAALCLLVAASSAQRVRAQGGVEVTPLAPPAPATAPAPAAPTRTAAQAEQEGEQSYSQGRFDAAITLYEEAAHLQTVPAEAARLLVVVASLQHRLGHTDAAIDAMARALTAQPDYVLSQENFTPAFQDVYYEGRKRALEQRARNAQERIAAGNKALAARDYASARQAFQDALAIDPALSPAVFGLAEVDREAGSPEAALAGFQKLLALRRSTPDAVPQVLQVAALGNVGLLYYDKGFYEDAESALAEAVTLDANSAQTWTNLGLARRKLGKRQEATEALRRAYTLDPTNETAAGNLALTYIDGADWINAVALLLSATQKTPGNAQLWLNLGIAQQGMENLDGAIGSFQRALTLDPENQHGFAAAAAGYLALAYSRQGRFELASDEARRQVQWSPEDASGWINLGQAQLSAGQAQEAKASLEHALTLDPARPEISNNLGSAYYRLGDFARAADAFQRALTMRSDYLAAADNLGMAKRRLAELDTVKKRLGLDVDAIASGDRGIVITAVAAGSPAARADMLSGDVIQRIEGNAASSAADLAAYLALQPPVRALTVETLRAGKVRKAKLKLN